MPIIFLRKIVPGLYMPVLPVWVAGDDVQQREFLLVFDEEVRALVNEGLLSDPLQRRYAERTAVQRLHQPEFRIRVLRAYKTCCTVCALRRRGLLDAAHIIGDSSRRGDAVVSNGLSMCKIHHAAYDQNLLGITPDREVRINDDLLVEIDGPMLRHGLQEMHARRITVPTRLVDRPDPERLDRRYQEFLRAS